MDLSERIALQAHTKAQIRAFFDARNVIEVTVPSVMPAPVTDPYIEVPRAIGPDGAHLGYLQSSPEYAMKRLLAQGSGDIFTLTPAWQSTKSVPDIARNLLCSSTTGWDSPARNCAMKSAS